MDWNLYLMLEGVRCCHMPVNAFYSCNGPLLSSTSFRIQKPRKHHAHEDPETQKGPQLRLPLGHAQEEHGLEPLYNVGGCEL